QIHSWLTKHQVEKKATSNEPQLTSFEKTILKLMPTQKTFSTLYTNMLQHNITLRYPFVIAWEKDLGQTFPEAMWRKMFITPKTLTLSANHTELSRKILYRWYLVPTRLKQMYPEASDKCWRYASTARSMIYIWWTCPVLNPYWTALTKMIHTSTGIRIPQTPDCLLLHNYPPMLPKTTRYLTYQINIAALTLISRSWKKAEAPTMPQCIQLINTTRLYELASRTAFPTRATFWKTAWQTWEAFENKPPPLPPATSQNIIRSLDSRAHHYSDSYHATPMTT
ncbi:Hypothetical predicted protein, partial [Pelobates cultripes]